MIIKNIRLIKNIIQKPQRVGLRPFHIQLEPTNNCNLKCKMCIRNEMNFKDHSMSFDEYKTVFDMIKPSKITFAGAGEPTCSADLFRMI